MSKYIDAEKLIEWLKERRETTKQEYLHKSTNNDDLIFLAGKYLAFTTAMFHVERMQQEKTKISSFRRTKRFSWMSI